MTGSVNLNRTDPVTTARMAWGEALPAWVACLAEEAARTSGAATAKRIGRSGSLVSQVIARKYPGDLGAVEVAVRGALMGETVECPVLGDIGRDQCLDEQGKSRVATSALRIRVYRACRSGCPHSRLKGADDADDVAS